MLVRTFRLTDKFSNALLRMLIWLGAALAVQIYQMRLALWSSLTALSFTISQTLRSGQVIYESNEERRRAIMARRTAEAALRPVIREDPLKTQNRALSMFTVVLMASLLMLVLWFTGNAQTGTNPPKIAGALPAIGASKAPPSPFPTLIPTSTPIPDPLRAGGSIVYALRDRGHENLWALGIGQAAPIRLTNTTADDRDPVWSPDGSKVAFASHRDGNWEIYVLEVATGNTSRLTYDLGYEGAPSWSPDGKFIVYEGYENDNLDIYIAAADGSMDPKRLTSNPAPDFSPAWSPDGRRIAYISVRDGSQQVYIISLDRPVEDEAIRFTRNAEVNAENPTWSPDGQQIAYSARVNGLDLVYVKPVSQPDADPIVVGQGHEPAWSPNGASLVFAVDNGPSTTLVGGQVGNFGVSALAISLGARAHHPSWSNAALPSSLIQSGGVNAAAAPPLYKESVGFEQQVPPYNKVAVLSGMASPNLYLNDKVDDSFMALRQAVVKAANQDFLGNIKEAFWGMDHLPEPGQSRQNWHYAGRAFAFDRNLVFGKPPPIEVVKEEVGVNTFWRLYIRVPQDLQNGQLGEPLKELPWDFESRTSGDPQAFEQGGRLKKSVPKGYYVDFTKIAEDYGWFRVPSERTWRSNFPGILFWEYDKRDGLSWNDAMLQLYTQAQINSFLAGPTQVPTPLAPPSDTPGPAKTATPIPPDVKQNS